MKLKSMLMAAFYIRILKLCPVLLCLCAVVYAQAPVTVKGKVFTSEDATPLPGVSILLHVAGGKPSAVGMTNEKGEFQVNVPSNARLEFRFISYDAQTVSVNGRTTLTIKMVSSATALKEAVVVGYQKRSKETVTGAVARITANDIKDVPVSNIEQLMQGKVAGLNIQNTTGSPGFRGSATIRGISQVMVQGSGQNAYLTPQSPLYVIDGIPVDANAGFEYGFQSQGPGTSPLSMIPPEDVESIDVMKDAEATSLYGSKGANGVIVVTTKRGNSKVPIVRYTGNLFMNIPPSLRPTIGGMAERDYRTRMIWGTDNIDEIRKISLTPFLSDSLNPFYNNSTNWQEIYYQTTQNHSHNVSVSGGDLKLNYKSNLNYYSERGVIKNTGFDRYSLSLNVNFNPTKKLQVSGYLSAGLGKKLKGSGNGLTDVGAGKAIESSLLPGPSYFIGVGQFSNAIYNKNDTKTYMSSFYLNAMYELVPHVQISTNTSFDYTADLEDTFKPAMANSGMPAVYGYTGKKQNLYNRTMLMYSNSWKEKHNVYASVFSEATMTKSDNKVIDLINGPNNVYYGPLGFNSYYSGLSGVPLAGGFSEVHSIGFAANMQYNYDMKYVVNINYRADGNSYAGLENRWAKSPSVGLRWNFNKESWLEDWSWLDYGDVRFSYGINLRPVTNIYASQGWYDVRGNYNNVTRISPHLGNMPNPFLKPEKVQQYNYGFDMSVFNGRLSVIFDAYTKTTEDMLYERKLATSTGFATTYTNEASIYNYGYEATFTVRPLPAKSKINWTFSFNWAVNRDVLLTLPAGAAQALAADGTIINRVGYSGLANFLYVSEGVYRSDNDVPVDPVTGLRYRSGSNIYRAGDMKFRDVNGNYISDAADQQVAGSPVPNITGGFSSFFTWKNYSLNFNGSILFKRVLLNDALSGRLANLRNPYEAKTLVDLNDLNYWKGNGNVAQYPNPYNYLSANGSYDRFQTLFQEDGSYIKLNAVTVGYAFDRKLLSRYKMNALRLYATVTNLFMITGYSGPNPEAVTDLGRDYLDTYPLSRSVTLGLNIEF